MSKVAAGSIPEKITYVMSEQKEVNVGCAWDISWYEHTDDNNSPKNIKAKIFPTWPVSSGDESTMSKAIRWAEGRYYDYATSKHIKGTYTTEEVDNKPIKKVKVLSLEERGNGGRAYKITIDDKYYVDLREDVMMDTILKAGISPGGVLNGEFIWCKFASQTKLVRIGSELHRLVVEFDSKKDMKAVSKKALEVGGVYQDRKKNKVVFLGFVNTVRYKPEETPHYYERDKKKPTFTYNQVLQKKGMLFYHIWNHEGIDKSVAEMKKNNNDYYFKIATSHKYIEKIKDVKIPKDIVEFLRERHIKKVKDCLLKYTGHVKPQQGYGVPDAWQLTHAVSNHSEFTNMYPFEGEPVELFDIKKYLLFS